MLDWMRQRPPAQRALLGYVLIAAGLRILAADQYWGGFLGFLMLVALGVFLIGGFSRYP